jgi:hypothetical protein
MYNKLEAVPPNVSVDDHVILVLDPSSLNFKETLDQAVKEGFRYPLMATKFFDKDFDTPHLFLYQKYNHNYRSSIDDDEIKQQTQNVKFCMENYEKMKSDPCKIHIVLEQNTIDYLHDYSKKFKFNVDGKMEQREISGKLLLYETSPGTFIVKVDEKTANLGGKEQTSSMDTVASFHTHPLDAYHKYKVCMAWPSIEDYTTFLNIYAKGYGMFHLLGTVEGVYVITISDRLLKEDRAKILENFDYYAKTIDKNYHKNYPLCSSMSRSYKFKSPLDVDEENWDKQIDSYLAKMKSLKYFNVLFLHWKDATQPIPIHYKDIDGNCVLNDEQVKFNNLLKKNK